MQISFEKNILRFRFYGNNLEGEVNIPLPSPEKSQSDSLSTLNIIYIKAIYIKGSFCLTFE